MSRKYDPRTHINGFGISAAVSASGIGAPFLRSITPISINTAASTQTVSVVAANSLLLYGGFTTTVAGNTNAVAYSAITNGTTITKVSSAGNATCTWNGTLIEFQPGIIKSAGSGNIQIAAGLATATATITAVDLTKTIICFTGINTNTNSAGNWDSVFATLTLTNSTTITANLNTVVVPVVVVQVGYSYVEFRK